MFKSSVFSSCISPGLPPSCCPSPLSFELTLNKHTLEIIESFSRSFHSKYLNTIEIFSFPFTKLAGLLFKGFTMCLSRLIILLLYFKSWKMRLWKCCTQYASKFGKLSSGYRTGKGQSSFQSQRRAMPKNAQTTTQLYSSHTLVK